MRAPVIIAALTAGLMPAFWQPARAGDVPTGKPLAHDGGVEAIAIQPAGCWLVTGGGDGTARLWDLTAADPSAAARVVLRGHSKPITRLAISPDGRRLATGSTDETVSVWDLGARDPARTTLVLRDLRPARWPTGPVAGAVAFSASGRRLLTGFNEIRAEQVNNRGWRARVWDLRAADPTAAGVLLEGAVHAGMGSGRLEGVGPNPRWLVSSSPTAEGLALRVWDLEADDLRAGVVIVAARVSVRRAEAIVPEISPDGRWLFARTGDKTTDEYRLWDLRAVSLGGTVLLTRKFPAPARASGFSPDGRWLAAAVDLPPHAVHLWDLHAKDPQRHGRTLPGHTNTVRELAFSPEGHRLATTGDDSTVRLWDLRAEDPAAAAEVLHTAADLLLFTPNGRRLVAGDREAGRLHVWDLDGVRGTPCGVELRGAGKAIMNVVLSPDGRWLVTRNADKTARLWELGSQ
jgi:WD40 repeat protein